jgi:hypothetical protein
MTVDLELLAKPFSPEAVKTREAPGGRKPLSYVEGHTVIHRLNDATGNCWDFRVLDMSSTVTGKDRNGNDIVIFTATVELTIPGLGSRQHVGVQAVRQGAGEDLVKGAVTDALKKAATLFGVGLELYGADYEGDRVDHQPTPTQHNAAPGPAQRVPAASGGTITDKQIDFALMMQAACHLSDGDFARGLLDNYQVDDLRQLTSRQASDLIDRLKIKRDQLEATRQEVVATGPSISDVEEWASAD